MILSGGALCVAVAAFASVASGCGTASRDAPRPDQVTVPPSTGPATRAEAVRLARAINLRATDLPGFDVSPSAVHGDPFDEAFARCTGGVPSSRALVDIESDRFRRRSGPSLAQVFSSVEVMPSRSLAKREFAAAGDPRVPRCLSRYLRASIATTSGGRDALTAVRSWRVPLAAPGTDGAVGWRIRATLLSRGRRVALSLDTLGFALDRTLVSLTAGGTTKACSCFERSLFSLLVRRAVARRARPGRSRTPGARDT